MNRIPIDTIKDFHILKNFSKKISIEKEEFFILFLDKITTHKEAVLILSKNSSQYCLVISKQNTVDDSIENFLNADTDSINISRGGDVIFLTSDDYVFEGRCGDCDVIYDSEKNVIIKIFNDMLKYNNTIYHFEQLDENEYLSVVEKFKSL